LHRRLGTVGRRELVLEAVEQGVQIPAVEEESGPLLLPPK